MVKALEISVLGWREMWGIRYEERAKIKEIYIVEMRADLVNWLVGNGLRRRRVERWPLEKLVGEKRRMDE